MAVQAKEAERAGRHRKNEAGFRYCKRQSKRRERGGAAAAE
jgi:hypothetical protein